MPFVFQAIAKEGKAIGLKPANHDSRDWYRDRALEVKRVNVQSLVKENRAWATSTMSPKSIGKMYMFFYDPKHKDTLPFYDQFPLIFPIIMHDDGFTGINLHYLPVIFRAKLMDALYESINNDKYDETTRIKMNYQILNAVQRFKYFRPCIKRYLHDHVRSRFLEVPPESWDSALMLPTQRFKKATSEQVWRDSRAKIIGR